MEAEKKIDMNIEEDNPHGDRPTQQQTLWVDFEERRLEAIKKNLEDRFVVPPFSILDTRQGYWQEGKRLWLELGIKSELGRGESIVKNVIDDDYQHTAMRREADKRSNVRGSPKKPGWAIGTGTELMAPGTSMFDPVLCEIIYKWFCPANGTVLDPFAGGSVRGIVAEYLGYKYTGIELRQEQVESNKEQAKAIKLDPCWIVGDSEVELDMIPDQYDFIFSCPPYFNLEVYSDLPGELSAIKRYENFIIKYSRIIKKVVAKLHPNRFACFVVSNIRNTKTGYFYNFIADTADAFAEAGAWLYNEAILINPVGSLPIRIGRQFVASRKLGKTHQNVLIFFNGDPRHIKVDFKEGK